MSITLGEKLRQAREAHGLSISQVAEQTRISALYLSCIENDDFRILPGGIFNKGFVKSFAKAVGMDEQEALHDYAQLIINQGSHVNDDPKTYFPQVLTDDRSSSSTFPTIIFAAVILGFMTVGILMSVRYIQQAPSAVNTASSSNTSENSTSNLNLANVNTSIQSAPSVSNFIVEFKALKSSVSLVSISDGEKSNVLIKPDKPSVFQPKESLRLKYSKSQIRNVQMTINGKPIALPSESVKNRDAIEFEIKQGEFQSILESGRLGDNNLIKTTK